MISVENLKLPPHSVEAEQSVIGSLLIDSECFDLIGDIITAEDFYNRAHQELYRCIVKLIDKSQPVDLITVTDSLESIGKLEECGGFAYVGDITRNTPSSANVKAYAEIIKDRSIKRALIGAGNEILEMAYQGKDSPGKDLVNRSEFALSKISEAIKSTKKQTSASDIVGRAVDEMERRLKSKSEIIGISTGLVDLDKKTSGLQDADLIVIAARPSMGKTSLAMNMVEHEALAGGFPLVFSIEMPSEKIMNRMISSISKVALEKIQSPLMMEDADWARVSEAIKLIKDTNLEIHDDSGITVMDVRLYARRYTKKYGRKPTLIMVDYLQLMKGEGENRTQEISSISMGLKAIGKEFGCPILALSQLNRGLENRANKRPINSDLRESGQIEQDADLIIFIYRDEVYHEDSQDKGLAEIIIGKNRNGPIGKVGAVFRGEFSQFRDLSGRELLAEYNQSQPKKFEF